MRTMFAALATAAMLSLHATASAQGAHVDRCEL